MRKKAISENCSKDIESTIKARTKKAQKADSIEIPTGADLLDLVVGGGITSGYPIGRVINLVGDKSSGKTFLACEMIAAAHHKYKKIVKWQYDDCESGFSFDTKSMYGIEIMPQNKDERYRSKTVEEAYCNIRDFAATIGDEEIGIYVLDSLDGLTSDEGNDLADERYKAHQKGGKFDKGSYRMGKPKYLSNEFFPQLAEYIEKTRVLLVVISQVRCNVDPMSFEKFSRAGGKALDFYCHTVLWLAQVNKMKKKGRAVGVTVKAKTTKSKTPRPYRECFFSLVFDYGLDNIQTNLDFLFDFLTPTGMVIKDACGTWGEPEGIKMSQLKQFLIDIKKEHWYRKNVNKVLKHEEIVQWINSDPKILKKFNNTFATKMSRADMVAFIEQNNLQDELTKKVIAKWEAIEDSIKSNRAPKYR